MVVSAAVGRASSRPAPPLAFLRRSSPWSTRHLHHRWWNFNRKKLVRSISRIWAHNCLAFDSCDLRRRRSKTSSCFLRAAVAVGRRRSPGRGTVGPIWRFDGGDHRGWLDFLVGGRRGAARGRTSPYLPTSPRPVATVSPLFSRLPPLLPKKLPGRRGVSIILRSTVGILAFPLRGASSLSSTLLSPSRPATKAPVVLGKATPRIEDPSIDLLPRRRRRWRMGFFEASIIHHVGVVLALVWALSWFGRCHPIVYMLCLAYLYAAHEHYVKRLMRRLQFEERKKASQRRVWPVCMQQLVSERFLLPIVPWFLDKYKPWTAKKAVLEKLYLGRSPPVFTDIRVVHPSADDDHLVLELVMKFLSADDMSAVLAVKLRKRLGLGMWAKLHVTGIHVEGKVLVGVKFLHRWPFLGRLRLCFVEPPFFQVTVKPVFSHGLDVTEIPGISGWVDKLLAAAFSETLVEPNMLVVDVDKFVDSPDEKWFTVDEKNAIAFARVELLEGDDMLPCDLNGLADPYVRGHLGSCMFQTNVQRKTLAPKWLEVFKIPVTSWETAVLRLEVRDKDIIFDDSMGVCSVNIGELRGGERHDMWLTLKQVKMGRLHLAVTVVENDDHDGAAGGNAGQGEEGAKVQPPENGTAAAAAAEGSGIVDAYEPVDIVGQEKTGVWVHQPGSSCASHRWEPRRGKEGRPSNELQGETVTVCRSSSSLAANSSLLQEESESDDDDEPPGGDAYGRKHGKIHRGLKKVGDLLIKSPKDRSLAADSLPVPTRSPNLRAVAEPTGDVAADAHSLRDKVKSKGRRDVAIGILKQVGSSAQSNLRKVLSKKGSSKMERGKEACSDAASTDGELSTPSLEDAATPTAEPGAPAADDAGEMELSSEALLPPADTKSVVDCPPSRRVSFEKDTSV